MLILEHIAKHIFLNFYILYICYSFLMSNKSKLHVQMIEMKEIILLTYTRMMHDNAYKIQGQYLLKRSRVVT